jgi:microcystin degradation protein MlrC
MSVVWLDDREGDIITRIREVVEKAILVSTSMDLHGNVSKRLAHQSDLITCYRMAPHEDALISKQSALENLLNRLEKGKPPYKAWIALPMLLPGEKTSARIEPGKSLYAKVPEVEAKAGLVDAAIWMRYPWADEPRKRGVVMVTGDNMKAVVESV